MHGGNVGKQTKKNPALVSNEPLSFTLQQSLTGKQTSIKQKDYFSVFFSRFDKISLIVSEWVSESLFCQFLLCLTITISVIDTNREPYYLSQKIEASEKTEWTRRKNSCPNHDAQVSRVKLDTRFVAKESFQSREGLQGFGLCQ